VPPSADELAIKRRIDELYTAYPFYGSRKIAAVLGLSRKRVQRHTLAPALQVQVCARPST
jgi:putative transposase